MTAESKTEITPLCIADAATFWPWRTWTDFAKMSEAEKRGTTVIVPIAGMADWGMDLSMGKQFLPSGSWWLITFPGMMIMILALGFTFLGEGLAEILNPKLLEK